MRSDLVALVVSGEITKAEAARRAGVHPRSIGRWVDKLASAYRSPKLKVTETEPVPTQSQKLPAKREVTVFLNMTLLVPSRLGIEGPQAVSISSRVNDSRYCMRWNEEGTCIISGVAVVIGSFPTKPVPRCHVLSPERQSVPTSLVVELDVEIGDLVYVVVRATNGHDIRWTRRAPSEISVFKSREDALAHKEEDSLLFVSIVG